MTTTPLSRFSSFVVLLAALPVVGCDKSPLLAPTQSTITVSAGSRELPSNGSTQITAVVTEQAGTAVQDGTTVRFSTTLGLLDPVESQTRNGAAVTTFFAANSSGVARIRAISGLASGGETEGNLVEITVGAAAVNTVTLRANPASVPPTGGTVQLIAAVVSEGGQPLQGILVTFSSDQGTLSNPNAITNASGEASTQLTTTQQAVVSASAGTKTSSNVTVAVRSGPIVTITCSPASGTGNCAAVPTSGTSNTATVVFTVTRPTGSSTLRTATIDFGDGSSQSLGNLAGGTATVTHTYSGPSNSTPIAYTATVQVTDVNGETAAVSTDVIITPRSPIGVSITDSCGATALNRRCTFTATVTGGGEGTTAAPIQSYTWDFGDGSDELTTSGNTTAHVYTAAGTYTVTVTVRTVDGRTATGRTQILLP
jgi:adhesin/invasin